MSTIPVYLDAEECRRRAKRYHSEESTASRGNAVYGEMDGAIKRAAGNINQDQLEGRASVPLFFVESLAVWLRCEVEDIARRTPPKSTDQPDGTILAGIDESDTTGEGSAENSADNIGEKVTCAGTDEIESPFVCPDCGKDCMNAQRLGAHRFRAHGIRADGTRVGDETNEASDGTGQLSGETNECLPETVASAASNEEPKQEDQGAIDDGDFNAESAEELEGRSLDPVINCTGCLEKPATSDDFLCDDCRALAAPIIGRPATHGVESSAEPAQEAYRSVAAVAHLTPSVGFSRELLVSTDRVITLLRMENIDLRFRHLSTYLDELPPVDGSEARAEIEAIREHLELIVDTL